MGEVFLTINGKPSYLWRAVDQNGKVLDILGQRRRKQAAAKKFFRKLLTGCQYVPRVLSTDNLGSYEATHKEVMPRVEHRRHRRLNNRAANSHHAVLHVRRACATVPVCLRTDPRPLLPASESVTR